MVSARAPTLQICHLGNGGYLIRCGSIAIAAILLSACGGKFEAGNKLNSKSQSSTSNLTVSVPEIARGKTLYSQKCAGCHGSLENSTKLGKSPTDIQNALNSISAMSPFRTSLASSDIQAIALGLGWSPARSADAGGPGCKVEDPGRETLHRLNRFEYGNTLRDLLGINSRPGDSLPADGFAQNFDNNADVLTMNSDVLAKFLSAAEAAVSEAIALNRSRIFVCTAQTDACARTIVQNLVARAFRRPVLPVEVDKLMAIYSGARSRQETFDNSVSLALQAMLVSPHFLFRGVSHPSPDNPRAVQNLNHYEIASRLSYFLWSSMPDDVLFAAANNGQLQDPAVLRQQVTRMLASYKSAAMVPAFASQWLGLRKLDTVQPDTSIHTQFTPQLRTDMKNETETFMRGIFANDLSIHEMLTARYSYLTAGLGDLYGVSGVTGTAPVKTSIASTTRQGILGQASILTITSHEDEPSIVLRGKWIMQVVLCESPPPPPQTFEKPPGSSEIERSQTRLTDVRCMSCHTKMDPLGRGLQMYNAIGKFRTLDEKGIAINGDGQLPDGTNFHNPQELANAISASPKFKSCVAKKMLSYALGRDLKSYDTCAVDKIAAEVGPQLPISRLIQSIVVSDPFLKQRGDGGQE